MAREALWQSDDKQGSARTEKEVILDHLDRSNFGYVSTKIYLFKAEQTSIENNWQLYFTTILI